MNELKAYIIRLVIVTAIVELGAVITGEKYKKIYSLVGAVFIIFAMLSFPGVDLTNVSFKNHEAIKFYSEGISERFTYGVSQKIKDAITEVFDKEVFVFVSTDSSYSKICITIKCECSDEMRYKIEEYVTKTFCSSNDEVIIISE